MDNPPEADYPHIHRSVATTAFLEFYYIANLKAATVRYPFELVLLGRYCVTKSLTELGYAQFSRLVPPQNSGVQSEYFIIPSFLRILL